MKKIIVITKIIAGTTTGVAIKIISITSTPIAVSIPAVVTISYVTKIAIIETIAVAGVSTVSMKTLNGGFSARAEERR